jgi:hypothetical protein
MASGPMAGRTPPPLVADKIAKERVAWNLWQDHKAKCGSCMHNHFCPKGSEIRNEWMHVYSDMQKALDNRKIKGGLQ